MSLKSCSVVLLLLLPVALSSILSGPSDGAFTPLFAWSNKPYVIGPDGMKVLTGMFVSPEEQTVSLVKLAVLGRESTLGHGVLSVNDLKSERPAVVVVFAGKELLSSDLRKPAQTAAISGLKHLVEASQSSLTLSNVMSGGESSSAFKMFHALKEDEVAVEEVNCGPEPVADFFSDLESSLSVLPGSQTRVVVVCPYEDKNSYRREDKLSSEIMQLQSVQKLLTDSGLPHVVVYASSVEADDTASARRRSMQENSASVVGFGPYTTCGTRCQAQVRWLEALLAVLVLALASCAGMTCLYLIDTPTRFEQPKDETRRE